MVFTGWLTLNGIEIANSSRVVAHLKPPAPTDDSVFTTGAASGGSSCGCGGKVVVDDGWSGLVDYLGNGPYTDVISAPWYRPDVPQSAEFRGIWPMKIDGLDTLPVDRRVTELIGDGAILNQPRVTSRKITVDALLIACTSAGLQYGRDWLQCVLGADTSNTDAVLSFLSAHPGHSDADPYTLQRDLHSVVLTDNLTDSQSWISGDVRDTGPTSARVTFSLTALSPHAYRLPHTVTVNWDSISTDQIRWVHATDCSDPGSCPTDLPVLFSTECVPTRWPRTTYTPPVCGGCLPVGDINTRRYRLPALNDGLCGDLAVSVRVVNTGGSSLSVQGWLESCTPGGCPGQQYPFQISGLPTATEVMLDAVTGRFWAVVNGVRSRPSGIVSTPHGGPWRPPVVAASDCWELVVRAPAGAQFEVELTLRERD